MVKRYAFVVYIVFFAMSVGFAESTNEDVLKARVSDRWAGLIEHDFDKVYSFLTPSYRKIYSLNSYKKKIGLSVQWLSAAVKSIEIDGNVANVNVNVRYTLALPGGFGDEVGLITSQEHEKWLFVADNWWLVELKVNGI